MDQLALPDLQQEFALFGYLGIFLFFITIDQLTVVPEEITLLSIGYLCSKGVLHPVFAGIFTFSAFIVVDSVYFFLPRANSKWMKRMNKRIDHSRIGALKEQFNKHYGRTILLFCFIPRMRFWAPILSSITGVPYKKFILFDLVGLGLFTTGYILTGMLFHNGLKTLFKDFEAGQNILFFGAVLLLGAWIVYEIRKKG